jgi:hypothetical protein
MKIKDKMKLLFIYFMLQIGWGKEIRGIGKFQLVNITFVGESGLIALPYYKDMS